MHSKRWNSFFIAYFYSLIESLKHANMAKLILFLCIVSLLSCTQQQAQHQIESPPPADTAFILRNATPYSYHAIYIDSAVHSNRYQAMLDFSFQTHDSALFQLMHQQITAQNPHAFQSHKLFGLPTHWLPLYPYQSKLYLYSPCEWGYLAQRILSDSAYIAKYNDGAVPYPLSNIQQLTKRKYLLSTTGAIQGLGNQIYIHVLDTTTFLSLWEFPTPLASGETYYQLYIPSQHVKKYDIIVNDCRTEKEDEFYFDQINYDSLKQRILD